ncbi:MAG: P1 family peptidase [Terriglobia bacterium]
MTMLKRRAFNQVLVGLAASGVAGRACAWERGGSPDPDAPLGDTLTDVPGIKVGHFTETRRPTGCTVILFNPQVTASVDYDSSTPGSYRGVRLQPASLTVKLDAMFLTGGGAYGLSAVAGVDRYFEELHQGAAGVYLPSVAGASIFDLEVGNPKVRPDGEAAYQACKAASTAPVQQGNVGAGAGATVGKLLKGLAGMKGGLGSASVRVGDAVIGSLAVVNGMGDIIDRHAGKIIAGARRPDGRGFANIVETLKRSRSRRLSELAHDVPDQSTNLVVIATNVAFGKLELAKVAAMGSTGAARVINPYHTAGDGDSTFAFSTNQVKWPTEPGEASEASAVSAVGTLAAETASESIIRAVKMARSIDGWPACRDYPGE